MKSFRQNNWTESDETGIESVLDPREVTAGIEGGT